MLVIAKFRLQTLSSVHRHLDYFALQLSRWVGYSRIHRSLIGETLKELLLLLRACSVLFKDNDHFIACADIFCVNCAFATHLDDFADLILRLSRIFCQTIRLFLDVFL